MAPNDIKYTGNKKSITGLREINFAPHTHRIASELYSVTTIFSNGSPYFPNGIEKTGEYKKKQLNSAPVPIVFPQKYINNAYIRSLIGPICKLA